MGLPVIAYKSMLRSAAATVTDPGTESGFSAADIHDYKSYSLWKSDTLVSPIDIDIDLGGTTETTDYVMLVNHNLSTEGGRVTVYHGAAFPPVTIAAFFDPAEDTVSYNSWTQTSAFRYWRVTLSKGGNFANKPFVGELFLGNKTEMPLYLSPRFDPFFKQVEVQGHRSRGGHYLAASLRGERHMDEISFGDAGAPRADYTSNLNAFLDDHAYKRRPFGFIVDPDDSDFDSARYVKARDETKIRRRAVGGTWNNLALTLPIEEAFSEPV